MAKNSVARSVACYLFVIVVAALAAYGFAGAAAPIVLALALPAALALSPGLRRDASFAPWLLMSIPAAVGLWRLSAGRAEPIAFGIAAIGAIFFVIVQGKAKLAFGALAVFVALIAFYSSGQGGSGPMIGWYERFGLTEAQAGALTYAFRKTVHFTFYGTVGWTALQAARAAGGGRIEAIRTGMLVVLSVASFDELRQSGYANRSGSPWDVMLDLMGAAFFLGLSEWRRAKGR